MKTKIIFFIFACLNLATSPADALEPIIRRGQLEPYSFPDLEKNANQIWEFVQGNVGSQFKNIQPFIYVSDFDFKKKDADWLEWQKNWIKNNPEIWIDWQRLNPGKVPTEDTNPFPFNFFAFHYDGTNRIQIGFTSVFKRNWVMGPDGVYRDYTGEQYYTIGHELHHIALEALGLPGILHHCAFVSEGSDGKESLVSNLANYLVDSKISSSFIFAHGYKWEKQLDPCARLSEKDRAKAEAFAKSL